MQHTGGMYKVEITTDGAGVGTGLIGPVFGRIHAICYTVDPVDPMDGTMDFQMKTVDTEQDIISLTGNGSNKRKAPRDKICNDQGAGQTQWDYFRAYGKRGEHVQVDVQSGGANKKGVFHVLMGD